MGTPVTQTSLPFGSCKILMKWWGGIIIPIHGIAHLMTIVQPNFQILWQFRSLAIFSQSHSLIQFVFN